MSIDMMGEAGLAVQQNSAQEMIRRKLEIDALRERLSPGQDPKEKLREACQGFETIFIQKLWDQMRKNVPKEGYLHSKQESMYQSMYDHEFSKKMTEAGGIGLADMLYEQLSQTMTESSRTTSPGINPRLPIVPATSSPSNIKFAQADQSYTPQIKPLYEDFDENAALDSEKFTLANQNEQNGQRGLPLPGRGPGAAGNADLLTVDEIDFEAESHELLRNEMEAGREAAREANRKAGQPQPVATAPEAAQSWAAPQVRLQASTGAGLRSNARRRVTAAGQNEADAAGADKRQADAAAQIAQSVQAAQTAQVMQAMQTGPSAAIGQSGQVGQSMQAPQAAQNGQTGQTGQPQPLRVNTQAETTAGNIPHPLPGSHGPGGLSPEQQRILAAALRENQAALGQS